MQLTNAPSAAQFPAVLDAFHDERINRYLPAAGTPEDAFRLYLWNCTLCEAFYLPLHVAEVVCRNAIHRRLRDRVGDQWFNNGTLNNLLSNSDYDDLTHAIEEETAQHGAAMTCHHLVSALSFGFWQHLLTKRFNRLLWENGLRFSFPNLPLAMGRQEVHDRIEALRRWRNRIAHHRAIFDKGPSAKFQECLQFVRWVSDDVGEWLASGSQVNAAISVRPV
jgi:hypothetical protein